MFQREITSQNEPISAYRNIERRGHNDHRANYGKRRRCGVEKDSFKCGSKYDLHKLSAGMIAPNYSSSWLTCT